MRQAAEAARDQGLPGGDAANGRGTIAIRETARAAVAISGMAPTLVGYVAGGYALLASDGHGASSFLYIYVLVIGVGVIAAILAAALVSGRSAMAIAIGRVRLPPYGFGPTPATAINLGIYGLNGFLIVLACLVHNGMFPT